MKRWHLTPLLAGTALAAAAIVPVLTGSTAEAPPAEVPAELPVEVIPVEPAGHVHLDARLDRSALLAGTSAERHLTLTLTADSEVGVSERRPVDVVVVMDTSGSMAAAGKITYARRAAREAVGLLGGTDRFGVVTFASSATIAHASRPLSDSRDQALHTIDGIRVSGDTNIYDALRVGAQELSRDGDPGGRLVLLSDGIATAGPTRPDDIGRLAEHLAEQNGVVVSAIGLGLEHDEDLLARVALAGGGDYDFVDDPSRLIAVLADDVQDQVQAVARDLHVEVELPDGVELVEVHGWRVQHTGPRTLSVPMGDLAAGESRKVVAQVRVRAPEQLGSTPLASVRASWYDLPDDAPRQVAVETTATVTQAVAVVEESMDETAAAASAQAVAASLLTRAARAYSRGDGAEAGDLAQAGLDVLEQAPMSAAPEPEVAEAQLERMRERTTLYATTPAASPAGRKATLEDKADAFEWAQ